MNEVKFMNEIELKPGNESSEYKGGKALLVVGLILAVASSLGKVPFTPDQLSAYLANVIQEATSWTKVLAPYITLGWAAYASFRTYLKKKQIEAHVEIKKKEMEKGE